MTGQDYYLKKRRGIYLIQHKTSLKCYVGQSVDIVQRWRSHCTPGKSAIAIAIAAEPSLFTFQILEECSKELLNEREKHYIQVYDCIHPKGYNKTSGGSSATVVSEDTKKKISKAAKDRIFSEDTKRKMSEAQKGKTISEETRQKLKESAVGRKLPPVSEETRCKMSESRKGRTTSEETRHRHSEAACAMWARRRLQQEPLPVTHQDKGGHEPIVADGSADEAFQNVSGVAKKRRKTKQK